jgi:hypothetical protein
MAPGGNLGQAAIGGVTGYSAGKTGQFLRGALPSSMGGGAAKAGGSLLGGATGDVAATLTATLGSVYAPGTIGTDWDTIAKRRCLWKPTDTIRFDRITSAFTAGAGNIIVVADLLRNPGA